MKFVIIRTNGKVAQVWEDNEAAWSFFIGHLSRDVHWRNLDGRENPKLFEDFWHAGKFIELRQKYLKPTEKKNDKEWEYHIVKEENIHDYYPKKRKSDADPL